MYLCRNTEQLLLEMLDLNPLVLYFDILVNLLFSTIQQFVILVRGLYHIHPYCLPAI